MAFECLLIHAAEKADWQYDDLYLDCSSVLDHCIKMYAPYD